METMDRDRAWALLADPATTGETLAQIAAQHREFWPQVSQHPAVYPGLVEWMQQQGFTAAPGQPAQPVQPAQFDQPVQPQTQPAFAGAGYGQPQAQPMQPMQAGAQPFPAGAAPKKRRTGLFVALAAGLVVVVAAAIAIPLLLSGSGGGSMSETLKRFERSDEFNMSIVSFAEVEAIVGKPFPVGGTDDEISDWGTSFTDAGLDKLGLLPPTGTEVLSLIASGRGWALHSSPDSPQIVTTIASIPASKLDELFGPANDGVWEAEDLSVTQVEGSTYLFDGSERPAAPPSADRSLAADESAVRVLARLEAEHLVAAMMVRSEEISWNLQNHYDDRADDVEVAGFGFGMRDGQMRLTLVWDFGSADLAQRNEEFVSSAVKERAEYDDIANPEVRVDGSLVIAEFPVDQELVRLNDAYDYLMFY